jgi:hypothetical protein
LPSGEGRTIYAEHKDATLAEHSAQYAGMNERFNKRFNDVDKRFNDVDKRFDEMRLLLGHTIGLGTTAHLRSQEFDQRHELSEGETRSLRARVDDLERRVTKVEEERDR